MVISATIGMSTGEDEKAKDIIIRSLDHL